MSQTPTPSARSTRCLGVRGAITVDANTAEAILAATRDLLTAIIEANQIETDDIGSVIFSTTTDLNAEYPAVSARQMGWQDIAIMCTHEMNVPHGLKRCVRVLIMWNTSLSVGDIRHIYLREAQQLRPDRIMSS